jgi:hypothetical protein
LFCGAAAALQRLCSRSEKGFSLGGRLMPFSDILGTRFKIFSGIRGPRF